VRLWVDNPAPLSTLAPESVAGVRVCQWEDPLSFDTAADLVIEAFGCELPEIYRRAMAARQPCPRWINLEYLGLEDWVNGCHGMPSPHPWLPLVKRFFFPGFTPQTGGLLRERDLFVRQAAFRTRAALLANWGIDITPGALIVSLFCYDPAPFAPLLAAWREDDAPLICLVPPGKPLSVVRACLGGDGPWNSGNARIIPIPFLAQDDYDELLSACDLNFVRGEDSFVRAQWAGKPFVWQIYPQDDAAHLKKLTAFLDRYQPNPCLARFWRAWNGDGADLRQDWPLLRQALPQVAQHNAAWREKLAGQEDLASALVKFCAAQV
jgi:uncharacterized repeat protein (TIGR03837 family)